MGSYPATAGTIHEHRQQAVEVARRSRREENIKTRQLYRHPVEFVKFGQCALGDIMLPRYTDMMTTDDTPKSAVELAMERLRKKDADTGIAERPTTDEQKALIAEARNLHASKVAELEILHRSKIAGLFDPDERGQAEDAYRRDLARLARRPRTKDCKSAPLGGLISLSTFQTMCYHISASPSNAIPLKPWSSDGPARVVQRRQSDLATYACNTL